MMPPLTGNLSLRYPTGLPRLTLSYRIIETFEYVLNNAFQTLNFIVRQFAPFGTLLT